MSNEVTELAYKQTISDLTGIEQLRKLEGFRASNLSMQVADFSEVPQLKSFYIGGRNGSVKMQTLDIAANSALEVLQLANVGISSVNLIGNTRLKQLYVYGKPEILNLSHYGENCSN